MKYQIWATDRYGDGLVTDLGIVDDPTDIQINVGTFKEDVIITIEQVYDKETED
jgi:hypothetical protein